MDGQQEMNDGSKKRTTSQDVSQDVPIIRNPRISLITLPPRNPGGHRQQRLQHRAQPQPSTGFWAHPLEGAGDEAAGDEGQERRQRLLVRDEEGCCVAFP